MASRYTPLYEAIAKLEQNHKEPVLIPRGKLEFPFDTMYSGQFDILSKLQNQDSVCLTSHTGFGKSPCFLSLTRNTPSLVIEPRKFLQQQISGYYHDFVLYGRSGYKCQYASSAASAPCLLKEPCGQTHYRETCPDAKQTCMATAECKIFPVKQTYQKFPCKDCEYLEAVKEAVRVIKSGGTVISNFGNFWNLLKHAETVVVDEADLFFREISAPIILRYSTPRKNEADSIQTLLDREVKGLQTAAKDPDASFRYKATNLLYNAQFLQANSELCFSYSRKDRIYIEIDPRNTNILSQKLFKDKRLIIVSATPGQFELPSYSASIHQRCGLYFVPAGNLTSKSLKQNPYLMNKAGNIIKELSDYFEMVYDNKRVIIHTGNLGLHASSIFNILGEENCTLHTAGKLAETIEKYLATDKRYLLVASSEYGLDAHWSKLQFSLKHPYPNLDERMNTLRRVMGPEFASFYDAQARTRIIQLSGRNCRSFGDFGVTVFLDSKTYDDYSRNPNVYPDWMRTRVDPRQY